MQNCHRVPNVWWIVRLRIYYKESRSKWSCCLKILLLKSLCKNEVNYFLNRRMAIEKMVVGYSNRCLFCVYEVLQLVCFQIIRQGTAVRQKNQPLYQSPICQKSSWVSLIGSFTFICSWACVYVRAWECLICSSRLYVCLDEYLSLPLNS